LASRIFSSFLIFMMVFSTVTPSFASTNGGDSELMKSQLTDLLKQLQSQNATQTQAQLQATSPWNKISRVNVKSSGEKGFGGHSFRPSLSADGRYVAFTSNMALIDGKNVQYDDIYIHDRLTGTTELVSYGQNQSFANANSQNAMISGNGQFVAFDSSASNLVANDLNGVEDIFVRDVTNGTTERVNVSTTGVEADDWSLEPSISADGRYVVYRSYATNLIDGDPVVVSDSSYYYIRDMVTNTTTRITNAAGEPILGNYLNISANGQYVVFESAMGNLIPEDFNNSTDVFVYEIQTGQIERVSVASTGEEVFGGSSFPFISGDGNWVTFISSSNELAPGTTEYRDRVYLHNRLSGTTELVSIGLNGMDPDDYSTSPVVSDDGRYVMYESFANNLVEGDFNDPSRFLGSQNDVFVYDTLTQQTERVVFPIEGKTLNGHSSMPAISANGKVVAFASWATTLTNESFGQQGIFVTYDQNAAPVWPSGSALSMTNVTQQSLQLNWSILHDPHILGYRIFQDGKRIGFAPADANSFTVSNIDTNNNYTFKVEAVNDSYIMSSNGPTLANLDDEPPVWPQDMVVTADAIAPTSLTISWPAAQDNSAVEYYEIYEVTGEQTPTYRALSATPFLFVQLNELTPDTEYKLAVRAVDAKGNFSEYSPTLTVITAKEGSGTIESALFVDLESGGKANLRWVPDGNAAVQTYEVWRAKGTEQAQLITTVNATTTTYQDSGLATETNYTYQVIGKDAAGNETYGTKLVTITTSTLQVTNLTWSLDQTKGYAKQGATLRIHLQGDPNHSAEALLIYKTVDNVTIEQPITLNEKSNALGQYEGSFQLPPGVAELTSLHATLSDNEGHTATKIADWQQPIQTTGSLSVNLHFNGEIGDYLTGARLVAWSESKRAGSSIALSNQPTYTLNDLVPADDYTIRLVSAGGKVLKETSTLSVLSGQSQEATLTLDIPATVQLKVVNPSGEPVSNMTVRLMDENDQFIQELTTGSDGKTKIVEGFFTNQTLKAQLDFNQQPYQSETKTFNLASSKNVVELTLTPLSTGTVEGVVTGSKGTPLANMKVIVYQTIENRSFNFQTVTDANGKYSLQLYEGTASLSFSSGYNSRILGSYNQEVEITANQTTTLDKSLVTMEKGVLNLQVYSRTIGKVWEGPFNLEQLVAAGYKVTFSNQARSWWAELPVAPPISIEGFADDKIEICLSHEFIGYTCEKVTMDENFNANATIYLEEKGGRIEGHVVTDPTGDPIGNWSGTLYKYNPDTEQWDYYWGAYPRGVRISTTLSEAGKYKLEIEHSDAEQVKRFAQTEFEIMNGEIKDLGKIVLNEIGVFSGQKGNFFTAIPTETTPGRTVTYRGTYKHMQDQPLNDVTLLLDIPKGTTFKEGSIVVNGKVPAQGTVTYNTSKNRYEVALNQVEPNRPGVVQYQVSLNQDLEQAEIGSTFRIAFNKPVIGTQEEIVGLARVRTPLITLNGVNHTNSLHVPLSGKAPANSEVLVFTGTNLLGKTKAIETGIWELEVDLPDYNQARTYKLRAESTIDTKTYRSEIFKVAYDKNRPSIQSITMIQHNGNKVVFDPSKGVARFPFVVNPNLPVQFEVALNDPSRARNVEVHMGDSSALALLEDGVYRASVPVGDGFDIYVTYDTIREVQEYDWVPASSVETLEQELEEARSSLPVELQDFEVNNVEVTETDGTYSSNMNISIPNMSENMDLKFSLSPAPDFIPSAADLASGTKVYDLSYDIDDSDGQYRITASAYVPNTVVQPLASESVNQKMMAAANVNPKPFVDFALMSFEAFLPTNDLFGQIGTIVGLSSNWELLDAWQSQLKLCPNPSLSEQIENLRKTMIAFEVLKYGVGYGGTVVGGLGVVATGGLALPVAAFFFSVGLGVGFALDTGINANFDMTESLVNAHIKKCFDEPGKDGKKKKYKPINPPGGGGGSGGGGPVASPVPKFDPSGYVYEAIESNRLEGVTATVLYKNPTTTLWEVWDAEWFEEINPQVTDKLGRYGWDVPEGWWQVQYEKEGYVTTKSAELKVLPPHFDVNIGMVSYAPPQVESMRAVSSSSGEDFVEVTFSKYIDEESLSNTTITLENDAAVAVEGIVKAVQNEQEEKDKRLTRVVRFVVGDELAVGSNYSVTVNPNSVISYSGVGMAAPYTAGVVVEEQDVQAPELVTATVDASGRMITLGFDESVQGDLEVAAFTLEGTDAKPYLVSFDAFDASSKKIIVTLSGSISAGDNATIVIEASSLKDKEGNANEVIRKNLNNTVQSDNAELSMIRFNEGLLSPAFDGKIKNYTLRVGKNVQQVEMSASLADDMAELQWNGFKLASGVARAIDLKSDETIITLFTKAENQQSLDSYTIKVIRTDALPQEPTVPTPPPGLPDAEINGNQADITAWFQIGADGKVIFNKEALGKLSNLAKVNTVTVDLTKVSGEVSLFMPAPALMKLVEKEIKLVVKTKTANVIVLPDLAKVKALVEKLGVVKLDDVMLRLKISEKESVKATSMNAVSKTVQLSFDIVVGERAVPLSFSKNDLLVELLINAEGAKAVKDLRKLGVYQYEDFGWHYVRSLNEAANLKMVFSPRGSGEYQIFDYQKTFADIDEHWAQQDIEWMASKRVVIGNQNNYTPDAPMTKLQFVLMLARALGLDDYQGKNTSYHDISANYWAFGAIEAVTRAGLVDVDRSGRFRPNKPITREEIVDSIMRAMENERGEIQLSADAQERILAQFVDADQIDPKAKANLAKAIQQGILNGVTKKQLQPKQTTTRAQAAVIIRRFMSGLGIL
jgi:large repetitive protein